MKVIADNGNKDYYMTRAIELIATAKSYEGNEACLKQAIGLLALTLVTDG